MPTETFDIYLEIGKKRTIAGAIDWPGWCRLGRDEESAVRALLDSGPRYAKALRAGGIAFEAPGAIDALQVVERLEGTATTDFGAPDVAPSDDARPLDEGDLPRLAGILKACWQALDDAMRAAEGKELRKGPRGGGRALDKIARHVLDVERAYLARLGRKRAGSAGGDLRDELEATHQAVLDTLAAAARGELPESGPRGGKLWPPRYFIRRAAWHVLDHVWEIEDRAS